MLYRLNRLLQVETRTEMQTRAETEHRAAQTRAEMERRAAQARMETQHREVQARMETQRRAAQARMETEAQGSRLQEVQETRISAHQMWVQASRLLVVQALQRVLR